MAADLGSHSHDHSHFPGERRPLVIDRVHPSCRLASACAWIALAAVCRDAWILSMIMAVWTLLALAFGPAPGQTLSRMGGLALALLPAWAILPLFGDGEGFELMGLGFHFSGLSSAAALQAKSTAILAMVLFHGGDTPWNKWVWGARKIGAPRSLVSLFTFTLRYMPLLAEEGKRTMTAARARGFDGGFGTRGYAGYASIIGSGLVRSYHRSERVTRALQARSFGGDYHVLSEPDLGKADLGFTIVSIALAAAPLAYRFLIAG